ELLAREVALAVIQLAGPGLQLVAGKLQLDAPVVSVHLAVLAVIAKNVIARNILLRLLDSQAEIVVIQQRLAARIQRQRSQRILRPLLLPLLAPRGAAGIHTTAARRSLGGIAQRRR